MHYYRKLVFVAMVVCLCAGISGAAFADCSTTVCTGQIQRLYTDSSGTLYIGMDGDESLLNCTSPAGQYITLTDDDQYHDRKYAMLLTAMSLGANVGLRIVDGSDNCELSYVYMDI